MMHLVHYKYTVVKDPNRKDNQITVDCLIQLPVFIEMVVASVYSVFVTVLLNTGLFKIPVTGFSPRAPHFTYKIG